MLRRLVALMLVCQIAFADEPRVQLLFLGVTPEAGAPGALLDPLPIVSLAKVPQEEAAEQTIFAAKLRSNAVSAFVVAPKSDTPKAEQFFLVTQMSLANDSKRNTLDLGGEQFSFENFSQRLNAVLDAYHSQHRRIGFVQIADPLDQFPAAINALQHSLGGLNFDLLVLMVSATMQSEGCADPAQGLHWNIISGLADRTPFGNGDGVSSAAEVEAFLSGALKRSVARAGECALKYSVLLKGTTDPDTPLVKFEAQALFAEMEAELYNETFDAMFLLQSGDRDEVEEFLESCIYCPNELALATHLRKMDELARTSALEDEIWQRIAQDSSTQRLAIYLRNCSVCKHRDAATALITELEAKAAASENEKLAFGIARQALDVSALRTYVETCIACAFQSDAEALIAEIEADAAYQAEKAAFTRAMSRRDTTLMQAFLESCKICEGREELTAALAYEVKRAELSEPCLRLAGVPQLGGPRRFETIDQANAATVCAQAARAFPDDGVIQTTLGRIAQASGNFAAAEAAYRIGMKAGVPAAFGLAAYVHYAPPENEQINIDMAEQLARRGAELGDWLSQEILAVLYSKELVAGKTPADGFHIAENIAKEGNALAEFLVGYYYLTGTGVEANTAEAKTWLQRAVGQGYTHANSFLAELHEAGSDGDAAPDKAAELYWQALAQGDPTATDRLTTQLRERNRTVIRIIQKRLRDEGSYRGPVDGLPGPSTVNAVRAFAEIVSNQS